MKIKKPQASILATLVNWYVTRVNYLETRTEISVQSHGDNIPRKYSVIAFGNVEETVKKLKITEGSCIMVQGTIASAGNSEQIIARTVRISGKPAEPGSKAYPSIETREFRYSVVESIRKNGTVSFATKTNNRFYYIYCFDETVEPAKGAENGDLVSVSAVPMAKITGEGSKKKLVIYWKAFFFENHSR